MLYRRPMRATIAVATLFFLAPGCVDGDGSPEPEQEAADLVAGRYEITTVYDLSASEGVPSLVGDILTPLAGLRDDPGGTLIGILESEGGPIGDLLSVLPSSLKDELDQQIDDYVAGQIAAGGAAGDIIVWIDEIAGILTHFEVVSQFEVGRSDAGVASANHSLAAVRFELGGATQTVNTPDLINTLTIARGVECSVDETEIAIAEHAFHLPLGDFAVVGFNQALEATLGAADVGAALGMVIDCPALAADIGELCLDFLCIPESDIADLCQSGLDLVAAEIEKQIASIEFAELRLAGGSAALEDAVKGDFAGQIDRWGSGHWQSEIEIDGLVVPVEAPFTASRLAP